MILLKGDCLDLLKELAPNCIDALVTDPPAGISFMGKEWDSNKGGSSLWVSWMTEVMSECLRVLKPGAHGLVWALPRTSHRTGAALEDAGFEIRDIISHLFASGFPKSVNLGEGRGTALKPASEHWILVRRPCSEKTVAKNVEKWGTGGINIDSCRVGTDLVESGRSGRTECVSRAFGQKLVSTEKSFVSGRWPANLVFDEETAERLGPASRFFYCPKASKSDRGDGNTHPTVKSVLLMSYLCKLITPPGGLILDPFMGSGSTGLAAKAEGFHFVGIEKQYDYFAIAEKRISAA